MIIDNPDRARSFSFSNGGDGISFSRFAKDFDRGVVSYCETLTAGRYDDWRLLTVKELATILALDRHSLAIDTEFFQIL